MAKLADAADLKSAGRKAVGVQFPLRAPARISQNKRPVGSGSSTSNTSRQTQGTSCLIEQTSVRSIRLNLLGLLRDAGSEHDFHISYTFSCERSAALCIARRCAYSCPQGQSKWADELKSKWPHTASVLYRMAASFEDNCASFRRTHRLCRKARDPSFRMGL